MAKIQLNGKKIAIKSNISLMALLKKYRLNKKRIAVEHNGKIIPKTNYSKKFIKNKDKIEIVHFIGGG
tara:strand:+ start:642 stop:845 length:204 start_codon:yes stop_codon:yes gene_type:complete